MELFAETNEIPGEEDRKTAAGDAWKPMLHSDSDISEDALQCTVSVMRAKYDEPSSISYESEV